MAALLVFIVSIVLAVISFKKVSKGCRDKARGKFRTLITALLSGFVVFIVTMGVGAAAFVSSDKDKTEKDATTVSATTPATASAKPASVSVYTCTSFKSITQTQQGTQHRSGYYSDRGVNISYNISADSLSQRLYVTETKTDSTDTAKFNKIADDGSRKYGNPDSNYFVQELNDTTVKVIVVSFQPSMTVTQICSKS